VPRHRQSFGKVQGDNIAVFSLVTNTLAKDKEIEDRWRNAWRTSSGNGVHQVLASRQGALKADTPLSLALAVDYAGQRLGEPPSRSRRAEAELPSYPRPRPVAEVIQVRQILRPVLGYSQGWRR
jgi:hypothetical protein